MPLARLPIAVLMQRRTIVHRWADAAWSVAAVVANLDGIACERILRHDEAGQLLLVPGLTLELHRDENDGYFENWMAPQPKVFVMWRLQQERALPMLASVSYGEGTRMLDCGEAADGVAMPADIHCWLGDYLQAHYRPGQAQKMGRPQR